MSNNCLQTKMKVIVNNNNLLKKGEMRITQIKNASLADDAKISLTINVDSTYKISGYIASSSTGSVDNYVTLDMPSGSSTIYCKNTNQYLSIISKYDIRALNPQHQYYFLVGINEFDFSEHIQYLNLRVEGDVSALSDKTAITYINFGDSPDCIGNILSLGTLTALTTMSIYKTGIIGTLESFVSKQIENGRTTSGTPIFSIGILSQVTFGGNNYARSFDSMLITWESATKIAVYKGGGSIQSCNTVYCKGYTQEEAETAFSGKTIIRVDA